MICHSTASPRRTAALALAALAVLALAGVRPLRADDTELLRRTSANPYVFFLLDTSASMTLAPDGSWVHGNGDDPRSKLYQAKRVLYEVFQEVEDIRFGFASMNQNNAAAFTKHWLYYHTGSLPSGWPIDYPRADPDGPVLTAADGTVTDDLEGDLMTFGRHFDATGVAGTCAAPLSLATQREKINRYSKLGVTGSSTTVIWILGPSNKKYRLSVSRPGNKPDTSVNAALGQDGMNIRLQLDEISNCTGPTVSKTSTANLDLKLWTDFLMVDEDRGATATGADNNSGVDYVGGWWNYKDINNTATCGSGHPFSGSGWEGNYDGASSGAPASVTGSLKPADDPYCLNPANAATCYNLRRTTSFDSLGRPLDRGDVIPLDWRVDNKQAFLDRLAPNQSDGTPDFRIASYFKDQPDATTGALQLLNSARSPLIGTGPTPLGKMVIDFRCFYLGSGNKCNTNAYNPGWAAIAQQNDRDWGCRRPYLIVISDGGDSCPGENPCADTANLFNAGDVRTWVIAYGANCAKAQNPLSCMAQNGKGELVCPQNSTQLKQELLKILGEIKAEARAFASAAVPSVQAIVDDKIFLTNFTPFNLTAAWEGHIDAFLKPLPLRSTDGKPDITHPNHLWDAGLVLRDTQVSADPLGSGAAQRRVYYAVDSNTGLLMNNRRLFDPTTKGVQTDAVRRDLWRGMEIPFITGEPITEGLAELLANSVINTTLSVKTHKEKDPVTGVETTFRYLLGDIFHSNPLVIGSPPNTLYFNNDVPGYRDFFRKHELRRKMLLVGSNDGMLHAFDAGTYDEATEKFNNGTGKELFAFIPREMLPTVRRIAKGSVHQWGVDGSVTVADVFIDPKHTGTPADGDREWRTILVGGMREGGSSYFALDITQPDELNSDNEPQPDNGYVPSCNGGDNGSVSSDCGPLPFPAALWEFTDSVRNASGTAVRLDEDANGKADLGFTWSVPNIGRIRLTEGGDTVDKFVMVAGGGFDPDSKAVPNDGRGTWVYMIDIETGKAIYKRKVSGAVPSEPSAVDTNQDGYLDRIYIATTGGFIYRIDLRPNSSNEYPALVNTPVRGTDGVTYTAERVPSTEWVPRLIFNANTDAGTPLASGQVRPIYYRPSVVYVAKLGLYALSFGTGDREDLWANLNEPPGRFYVFVDETDLLPANTIVDESYLTRILPTSGATSTELLFSGTAGRKGWYLALAPSERLITDPFALSGVSFFSTYTPDPPPPATSRNALCSRTGQSNVYIVSTVNANPFMTDANNAQVRSFGIRDFVTNPFTEAGLTKNTNGTSGGAGTPAELCDTPTQQRLKENLKSLFPARCKFSNQTVDIKTISSDTRLFCIAPVPVCTIEKNWREH